VPKKKLVIKWLIKKKKKKNYWQFWPLVRAVLYLIPVFAIVNICFDFNKRKSTLPSELRIYFITSR
jgi:hypothetical protein